MSSYDESPIFSKSLALIEKTRRRVLQIDGADFPTKSSESARKLLLESLDTLANESHWPAMSPEALYNALIHIQRLVEEVELSTNDHISWPLVSYCDDIWGALLPSNKAKIFYSLTNAHNYTISSFSDKLANRLGTVLPDAEVRRIIGSDTLYCLQLASLEDDNLPLYANIGHEFGHALFWDQRSKLLGYLNDECSGLIQKVFIALRNNEPLLAVKRTTRIARVLESMAAELFCDLIGACIAGPAFLLSLHEMGWGVNRDMWNAHLTQSDGSIRAYPSFNFRLDQLKLVLDLPVFCDSFKNAAGNLLNGGLRNISDYLSAIESDHSLDRLKISAELNSDVDKKAIEDALILNLRDLKSALASFVQRCVNDFLTAYKNQDFFKAVSSIEVSQLLHRLSNDILPNIIPNSSLLGVPASFSTILNASALWRMNLLLDKKAGRKTYDVYADLQKLERMTSKSFEVSYIQNEFNRWKRESI